MATEDFQQIQIRCPKCTQRFRVGPELMGRMVECGACEFRFRVDEESQVKSRKFYPGEKRDTSFARYSRQPHIEFSESLPVPVAQYADISDFERFEPTPFTKIMVGLLGGTIMALTLLVLVTGGAQHGVLDGVSTDRRLVIASFGAVIGALMIVYANPRARKKAAFFAIVAAAGLISTPLMITQGSQPLVIGAVDTNTEDQPQATTEARNKIAEWKKTVVYTPMEKALSEAAQGERVLGIWLRGLRDSNAAMVYSYLMRVSGAAEDSHLYPRLNQNYLLVLINPQLKLEELVRECERVGFVEHTLPELHLIDVLVNNQNFSEQPINKLSDRTDGDFYQLNYRELQGIDIRRINDAILRLSLADPVQSRGDIIQRMVELLEMSDREMMTNLCKALYVWSDGTDGAPEAAMKLALVFFDRNDELPYEVMAFLVKWQQAQIYPILEQLWERDPSTWEELYKKAGPKAEQGIIKHLGQGDNRHRMSAARIAGRVGGKRAKAELLKLLEETEDLELKSSYEYAINAIAQEER